MYDTQSQTESILDIIKGVDNSSIMLPEFQRDFRWELEQTNDLVDSLIREIFIGTIIYGKPSFGITLREIDQRPRRGQGSRAKLNTYDYSTDKIKTLTHTKNLRIVLDGQQRITSLYRAVTGKGNDSVYIILKNDLDVISLGSLTLEQMVDEVAGEESKIAISVKLSDAYRAETKFLDDEDRNELFADSAFGKACFASGDKDSIKFMQRIYRRAIAKLIDLYKQQKMVAFYLLDMSIDKFCLFFERSNSRGIQLNFTDILAAKLYNGFNLRQKIEGFESDHPNLKLNREIIIRSIAYLEAVERNGPIKIDKKSILENLDAQTFQDKWDSTCKLYVDCLSYLSDQHYILSQDWMPSENMIIPLMMFLRRIKSFSQMTQSQRNFLQYWYWASIFSNRYSTASNEAIIQDCGALSQIAVGSHISIRGYFTRLRPLITEPSDLFSYNRKVSAIYRGVLNLLNYAAQGLKDWNSCQKLTLDMRLEDHHIYPSAYVSNTVLPGIDRDEAEQLVDCVVNRTLIPKLTNISVGKKAPSIYLNEIEHKNPSLKECLESHLMPGDMISDKTWDQYFMIFLEERAAAIYSLIEEHTANQATVMSNLYGVQSDAAEGKQVPDKLRLKDMVALGKVIVGDHVYTRKHPTRFASIKDGDYVDFEGEVMSINSWGQMMTGWSSISIYDSIYLERTGKPLKYLRDSE